MGWHEDFGDEPSVEERMPFGLSPLEMQAISDEACLEACHFCDERYPEESLYTTDMYEYVTMDVDPDTKLCPECYDRRRLKFVPDDPSLFDCYTPVEVI